MRQGGASNREVREIQVARAQVNLARTSHTAALSRTHTAGTMRTPSRRTSHDSYVDSNGIRRSANGAPLPSDVQPSAEERFRLRLRAAGTGYGWLRVPRQALAG